MKRSALIRSLDELGLQPLSFEVGFRSIKVLIIKRPKAGPDRSWRAVGTLQHQAVVRPFLDTSQIQRLLILVGYDKPQDLGVEVPTA